MLIKSIAIQMDDLEKIDPNFDTTLLLAISAQKKGCEVFCYNPKNLEYIDGNILASGYFVKFIENKRKYINYLNEKKETLNLNNFNVVLIRQDPPFDMNYITSTYLLEYLKSSTIVLNNPVSIRNSAVSLIDSLKVVLVLYPRSFFALFAEQVASFTSCGLSLTKIG